MSWNKIKTVLLVILLIADMVMLINLIHRDRSLNYIDADVIEDAVDILAASQVYVNSDRIPSRKLSAYAYETMLDSSYNDHVAKMVSGSTNPRSYPTPTGSVITMDDNSRFEFSGTFGLFYTTPDYSDMELTWESIQKKYLPADHAVTKNLSSLVTKVLNMSVADLDESVEAPYTKVIGIYGNEKLAFALCSQYIDNTEIAGHTVICVLVDGKLAALKGTWCFTAFSSRYKTPTRDQLNILFNDAELLETKPDRITSMDLSYLAYLSEDRARLFMIPGWSLQHESGTVNIFNAIDGTKYTTGK